MINKKENEYIVSFVRIDVIHVTVNAVDDVVAKDVATSIAKSGYGDKSIKIGKSRVV